MSESDGMEESLNTELRNILTVAAHLGEMLQRERENDRRNAEARSRAAADELQRRLAAEQATARASLARVDDPRWWDQARNEDIAGMYQTAHAWQSDMAEAQRARVKIEGEVRERYGVTIDGMDPLQAAESLEEHARRQERRAREDEREAHGYRDEAGEWERRADEARDAGQPAQEERMRANAQEAHDDAGVAWDSSERRDAKAADLRAQGVDARDVHARVTAETSFSEPPEQAVAAAPQTSQQRPVRRPQQRQQQLRSARSR